MTAKEKLAEKVKALSEDQAAEALRLLGLEEDEREWPDFPPAPAEIVARVRETIEALDRGAPTRSTEEVRRRLGLG